MNKSLCFILFLSFSSFHLLAQASSKLHISINKNLELFAIIGGLTESGAELWESYEPRSFALLGNRARAQFAEYQDHPAVHIMQDLFEKGLDIATLPIIAINTQTFPSPPLPKHLGAETFQLFASDDSSDQELWMAVEAFFLAVDDFYRDSKFEKWWQEEQKLYVMVEKEIKAAISKDFIPAMEAYYGEKHLSYNLVPAVHFPPSMGFGPHIVENGKKHIYNILAPLGDQSLESGNTITARSQLGYQFADRLFGLSLHEFGHSFVNPHVLTPEHKATFGTYAHYFEPIAQAMEDQAYGNWTASLVEHLVRAGEIHIMEKMGLHEMSKETKRNYIEERKFIYLPEILDLLKVYEQNRDKYPTYADYLPVLLEALKPEKPVQTKELTSRLLKGRVFESDQGEPIQYATVGIIGKANGIISNEKGLFELKLDQVEVSDSIRVSYLGYAPQIYALVDLDLSKFLEVPLYKQSYQLPVFSISAEAESSFIGNQKKSRFLTGWGHDGILKGAAVGLPIQIEEDPVRLKKLYCRIGTMSFDSVLLRMHVYTMKEEEIGKDILRENLFLPVAKKGLVNLPLEDKNIWLFPGNYLVTLEWVDVWGAGHGILQIKIGKTGKLYYRKGAEDNWYIAENAGPIIYLEVEK